ncbi:MAG: hypothetical protein NT053_02550, partial [Cyanobacteria bacterium]|nr:hypothetical protein [Cyanobacteriota bacterium]
MAVDLTIAAGSKLVLTDSASSIRTWAGEIVNRSQLEYRNEVNNVHKRVVFGAINKAAKFINEHEFDLIGQYASLTSNHGLGGWDTSGARAGQQQFINKGLFSRSGSGTSTIDIPFLNQGSFIAEMGVTHISGQDYVQMLGETLVRRDASITIEGNRIYQLLGGSFRGDGSLHGKLFNQSVVNPGESIGALSINGNYEQSHDGRIVIEIAGHKATARDSLIIRDHAKLNGVIEIDFANGFMPSIGDSFEIIRYGSLEGHLSLNSPLLNRGIGQKLSYRSDRLIFSVVNAEILGAPEAGRIVSAPANYISNNAIISPDYLWQSSADGTAWTQVGSGSSSYLVAPTDQGKQLRLVVSYNDEQGFLESVTMAAGTVGTINDGAATFSISGTPALGNTLTATNSAPDPDGNGTFSYSWQSSTDGTTWSPVGTNSPSYLVASDDQGKQLRLVVSYTDGQGFSESVTTAAGSVPLVNDGAATFSISGNPAVGNTLTATNTAADPDGNGTFSYTWQSFNGSTWSAIGINAPTYTLSIAEEGKQVSVRVSYLDAQGFTEFVNTDPVTVPVSKTATITGITDDVGLLQGQIANDGLTDDPTPTITGILSAALATGETLRIFNGTTLLGSATVDNTARTWFFTPTLPATAGASYSITARVADESGNLGTASAARMFSLDTPPPTTAANVLTLAVAPATVTEDGITNLVYTLTRTGPTISALTVNYAISGTADSSDYTGATPGAGKTISFAAGSATTTLTIDPTADTSFEPDETVALTLAVGTGYTIGTTAAVVGMILNDDTVIENQGNTKLLKRGDGKAFVEVGGVRLEITSPWGTPAGDNTSEWQMMAADTISGSNQILWRNNTSSFLHIWNLDANWTLQSTSGSDAFNSPRAWELETSFQVDATREGIIGSPFTTIEAQGNTKLLKRGDGKAFVEVGVARQEITSPWNSTAGSDSSEWQMLAAD